jgi:prefoldin subunit 5
VSNAEKQYEKALDSIDKSIKQMEAVREALRLWLKHLHTADGKVQGMTVRKLTTGNATMTKAFEDARIRDSRPG